MAGRNFLSVLLTASFGFALTAEIRYHLTFTTAGTKHGDSKSPVKVLIHGTTINLTNVSCSFLVNAEQKQMPLKEKVGFEIKCTKYIFNITDMWLNLTTTDGYDFVEGTLSQLWECGLEYKFYCRNNDINQVCTLDSDSSDDQKNVRQTLEIMGKTCTDNHYRLEHKNKRFSPKPYQTLTADALTKGSNAIYCARLCEQDVHCAGFELVQNLMPASTKFKCRFRAGPLQLYLPTMEEKADVDIWFH